MREGRMYYKEESDRYDIFFTDDCNRYGGLSCGTVFEIYIHGEWLPTRIEYSARKEDWYLVGVDVDNLKGLVVRI